MGSRWGEMGRDGDEEISLRATWDQGGRILSQHGGFQVTKGNLKKGSKRESARGNKKQGESTNVYKPNVYITFVCKCQNDCQLYVCK
jgi:hypothetical protein